MTVRHDIDPLYDAENLSPALRALTPMRRNFAILMAGHATKSAPEALRLAGWRGTSPNGLAVEASRLMRRPDVLAAIYEAGGRQLKSFLPVALMELRNLIDDPQTRDELKLKAITVILDRSGLTAIDRRHHQVTIDRHIEDPDRLKQIAALAANLGLDVAQLLGSRAGRRRRSPDNPPSVTKEVPAYRSVEDLV